MRAQDGQMKGAEPALKTGKQGGHRRNQTETGEKERQQEGRSQRESGKGESRVRESCQEAGYGSKSGQVKSTQPVETQERDSDCQFEYQTLSPP